MVEQPISLSDHMHIEQKNPDTVKQHGSKSLFEQSQKK